MPVQSVGERFVRPSSMIYRNLLAMEAEEAIRLPSGRRRRAARRLRQDCATPDDGRGVDEHTGDLRAGRRDAARPLPVRTPWAPARALGTRGRFPRRQDRQREWMPLSEGNARSPAPATRWERRRRWRAGRRPRPVRCRARAIPAVDSGHGADGVGSGRRIVEMVWEDLKRPDIVTPAALHNAVIADMALSGSTNSLIHLIAMARRLGHELSLDRSPPRASGAGDLQPDAGRPVPDGGPAFRRWTVAVLEGHPGPSRPVMHDGNGRTLGENIEGAASWTPTSSAASTIRLRERRARRPARDPRAARRGAQALGRRSRGCSIKSDPRLYSSDSPGPGRAHRRSGSAGHARQRAGAAGSRSDRRARDAGMGHAADPEEAARGAFATWCASRTRA